MLKKWIAPLHVYDFTEKTLHYHCSSCPAKLLVHADNGKPMRSKDLKSLFEKLNVSDRTRAVTKAMELGLL